MDGLAAKLSAVRTRFRSFATAPAVYESHGPLCQSSVVRLTLCYPIPLCPSFPIISVARAVCSLHALHPPRRQRHTVLALGFPPRPSIVQASLQFALESEDAASCPRLGERGRGCVGSTRVNAAGAAFTCSWGPGCGEGSSCARPSVRQTLNLRIGQEQVSSPRGTPSSAHPPRLSSIQSSSAFA